MKTQKQKPLESIQSQGRECFESNPNKRSMLKGFAHMTREGRPEYRL